MGVALVNDGPVTLMLETPSTADRSLYDEHAVPPTRDAAARPADRSRIDAALGDARDASSTSAPGPAPTSRPAATVTAVEPSAEMIARRPPGAAPAVRASAEALPFDDDSFDAAMAVLTVHHWPDREAGLRGAAPGRPRPRRHRRLRPGAAARLLDGPRLLPGDRRAAPGAGLELRARRRAAGGERRADPDPARLHRPLLRRALGAAGARPRPRRGAADVGLAEPLRGGPPSGAASASPPTSPRAPGRSATGTCAKRPRSTSAYD